MKSTIKAIGIIVLLYAGLWGVGIILRRLWFEHEIDIMRGLL